METIEASFDLEAAVEQVWPLIIDFLDIERWWPTSGPVRIEKVETEGEGIGCVRHIYNFGFPHAISERLEALDENNFSWSLSIVGVRPAGIVNYRADGMLESLSSGQCRMSYHSQFTTEPGREQEARDFLQACYQLMANGLEEAASS